MAVEVVILGGGFGGLNVARGLARASVRITLIDRHNYHLFQPLLYQVASAVLSPADIASPTRGILRRQQNVRVLLAEAQEIRLDSREVRLDCGTLRFDYLVVATGATHAYFGHDEWRRWAPGLKTLDDALEIRRRVLLAFERAELERDDERRQTLLTFVVVGGGPTGVELAGALAGIARHTLVSDFRSIQPSSARVLLLEGGPHLLSAFPADLRVEAERELTQLGVDVRTNAIVTQVDGNGVSIGPEQIRAATVLWAAGVAASPLGRQLGVETDRAGRVPVERDLTIAGRGNVFVIGDLALARDEHGTPYPGLGAVAIQQGRHVAVNIIRSIAGQPTKPFQYFDWGNMATIGRAAAVAEIRGLRFSGALAWFAWLFVHLFKLIGFRNRLVVLVQWSWAYFTNQRGVRLITGDNRPREPDH